MMKHFDLTFFHIFAKNSENDSANILLWNKHVKELESIAISDRVHRRTIKSITIQEEIGRAEFFQK